MKIEYQTEDKILREYLEEAREEAEEFNLAHIISEEWVSYGEFSLMSTEGFFNGIQGAIFYVSYDRGVHGERIGAIWEG